MGSPLLLARDLWRRTENHDLDRFGLAFQGEGAAFEEFALRAGDYALSMVAAVVRRADGAAHDVRIRVGAVTDRPTALPSVEAAVEGSALTPTSAREAGAAAAAAIETYGSIHASADYLRELTGTLVERALLRAWDAAA